MNTLRIGVITLGVAASAGAYLWLRGPATEDVRAVQAGDQAELVSVGNQSAQRNAKSAVLAQPADRASEPALKQDSPELTPPSQSLHQVLDTVNADIGPEGEYIDPATLAEVLRSDPELGRLLKE
jgi:hypothetical protein